jgi:hypothetical protein
MADFVVTQAEPVIFAQARPASHLALRLNARYGGRWLRVEQDE